MRTHPSLRRAGEFAAAAVLAFSLTACGGGNSSVSASSGSAPAASVTVEQVSTLAGTGTWGAANGQAAVATFNDPCGVFVDAAGNAYVADTGNHLIRKIDASGNVTTLAATTHFDFPNGLTVDASGNVYIADSGDNLIRKMDPNGNVTTLAGSSTGGAANGRGTAASFNFPTGLAVDASGNVFVADMGNNLIRKIDPSGNVTTLAGSGAQGSANGLGTTASFKSPRGLALDASGNLYVADSGNNVIRKIDASGNVTTFAGSGAKGSVNAQGTAASFSAPSGVSLDTSGNVYVADSGNNLIRKIDAAGNVTTLAGSGAQGMTNGQGASASFYDPEGINVDAAGNVYVADTLNNVIRKIVATHS
ncbi:NHL repeat-containing protein [Trinickia sp. NRRL B-1857]|uniref:NHL repeat-containing protein n=1 Tax=Trinickia sp. NRRL B-1857 TaxID=3162879 RepID=UPI003D2AE07B